MLKMFLTDCDGCLTDGGMYYAESGDEFKKFNARDGMGFQLLREKGIVCGIITGEENQIVENRARKLKLDIVEQGVKDKLSVVYNICNMRNIRLQEVAYVGDDINDVELLKKVGYACTVENGHSQCKEHASYISTLKGGDGAVRDCIEWILKQEKEHD